MYLRDVLAACGLADPELAQVARLPRRGGLGASVVYVLHVLETAMIQVVEHAATLAWLGRRIVVICVLMYPCCVSDNWPVR